MFDEQIYFLLAALLPILAAIVFLVYHYRSDIARESREEKTGNDSNRLREGHFGYIVKSSSNDSKLTKPLKNTDQIVSEDSTVNSMGSKCAKAILYKKHCEVEAEPKDQEEWSADHQNLHNEPLKASATMSDSDSDGEDDSTREDSNCLNKNQQSTISCKEISSLPELDEYADEPHVAEKRKEALDTLPGKLKKSKFVALNKKIEASMTDEQKQEETLVRQQQLEKIFELMKEQGDALGMQSVEDVVEQMKLYA